MQGNKFIDQLNNTKFALEFIKVIAPLISKHIKIARANPGIIYEEIGDKKEKKLKEILYYFGLLQTAVSDIELVLTFLKIENRKLILELYPTIESQEQYYKYHLENFIIRIVTITDVVGKLGNSIYETELIEEKCNGYTFKEKIKKTDIGCSRILEQLLVATKEIKSRRHNKLHKGETEIGYFESIVFWDELAKITKAESDITLDELTDTNIREEIDSLEEDIQQVITLVVEFLENATSKFLEIAER